jgi:transcriptional regulator with XRE-family HTH domain
MPVHYPKEINTLGDHIRKHCLDLKLLQRHVAEQIGVHEQTIAGWERNRSGHPPVLGARPTVACRLYP